MRTMTPELRALAMAKTGGLCFYCGEPATTIDHYHPISRYRYLRFDPENHVPACFGCNQRKKNEAAVLALKDLMPFYGQRMGLALPPITRAQSNAFSRTLAGKPAPYRKNKHKGYVGVPFDGVPPPLRED